MCWRCKRKLFELQLETGVVVPAGLVLELPCGRCKAMSRVDLALMMAGDAPVAIARSAGSRA